MPPAPKAILEASVPVKVRVLEAVSVLPLAIVKVPVLVVMVKPLKVVAVTAPERDTPPVTVRVPAMVWFPETVSPSLIVKFLRVDDPVTVRVVTLRSWTPREA